MTSPEEIISVQSYLAHQTSLDTLRFITCGSVDDGKSTLIGRMLYDAQCLFDDQVSNLKQESKKHGTQGNAIDFALLVDGLSAEREQGITIDVAYRFFSTNKRKFIIADTPGHIEYTRNMATGASTASLAVILVDARRGVLEQTRRHTHICYLMGIRHIILAVNKMDLVNYDKEIFEDISADYLDFTNKMEFDDVTPLALSALTGENVISRSKNMPWYRGPTLISKLETVETNTLIHKDGFIFPVQLVNRPSPNFRGYSGIPLQGLIKVGDNVRVARSGAMSRITDIWLGASSIKEAAPGLSVTIQLADELGISRGDVITATTNPKEASNQFEADIIWMSNAPGLPGRTYSFKLAAQNTKATISSLKYKLDVSDSQHLATKSLELNDIARVTIITQKTICFDAYTHIPQLGAFVLIDTQTNETLAAGMIRFALRRSTNIHYQITDINKESRRALNGHTSKVFWFTGLSGSGKSTIANEFAKELHARGLRTYILDGDNIRHGLNKDLGFTDVDRIENIRRISEVAQLMVDAGIIVITALISPFRAEREMARNLFEKDEFVEVFVDTPLEVCEHRDTKGLYKKARAGEIPNFTGIHTPYEPSKTPDLTLHTEEMEMDTIIDQLLTKL